MFHRYLHLPSTVLILLFSLTPTSTNAYTPLSDAFLGNITTLNSSSLLTPILISRVPGSEGHTRVQHHFVNFFSTNFPKWKLEWYNSTVVTEEATEVPIANLVFRREPPWTREGQANWLTLGAHYDSKSLSVEEGDAVACALMMHIASSIDQYATQMHTEMDALGEGGTVPMDMGVQIIFFDGKESLDGKEEAALYGSKALGQALENQFNPVGTLYETALDQISIFVMLDSLGIANQTVPSYLRSTSWAHRNLADLEKRMRGLGLLETAPELIPTTTAVENSVEAEDGYDYVPFMERGVPFLHVLPSSSSSGSLGKLERSEREDGGDNGAVESLDMPTVRDWSKIMVGFALEWLDMMEVWPE